MIVLRTKKGKTALSAATWSTAARLSALEKHEGCEMLPKRLSQWKELKLNPNPFGINEGLERASRPRVERRWKTKEEPRGGRGRPMQHAQRFGTLQQARWSF
jgi:hypothetical protein